MSKIDELVQFAKADTSNTEEREVNFGNVPNFQAQKIAADTEVVIKGAIKILSAYAVNHIFKRHGNHQEEQKRGQVGVVDSDFKLIPEILFSPDSVSKGTEGNRGQKSLIFKRKYSHTYFVIVSIYKHKQSIRLEVQTMYIKK